jgi:hypothetical protein
LVLLVLTGVGVTLESAGTPVDSDANRPGNFCFAVYALSRGNGVPDAARSAIKWTRALALSARKSGSVVTLQSTTIGLEGETRLCLSFEDANLGQSILEGVRAHTKGVDLFSVKVESCE